MTGWARIKTIAAYVGVSERTVRSWLKQGLRHSRVKGTVLIKFAWADEFIEGFAGDISRVDRIVEEVTSEVRTLAQRPQGENEPKTKQPLEQRQ